MNYLIIGFGKSGIGATKLLEKNGARIFVFDDNKKLMKKMRFAKIFSEKTTFLHKIDAKTLKIVDFIVISPGVEPKKYEKLALKYNKKIISELELAFMFCGVPVLAVTGTNGKTTTTKMLYEMMKTFEPATKLVGNVGTSFCETLVAQNAKLFVCEVSSFQLEKVETFKPQIAGFLNIENDHLDRYKNFESYFNAKQNIAKNFSVLNVFVSNFDDKKLFDFSQSINCKKYYFSLQKLPQNLFGAYFFEDKIVFKLPEKTFEMNASIIQLLGKHNLYNVMCASLMAILCGQSFDSICECVKNFKAPEHRLQFVKEVSGKKFYDDSKGTNIHSTLTAISCFDENILLLLGGKDKGENFDNLFQKLSTNVSRIFAFGETRHKILKSAKKYGFKNIQVFGKLKDAFKNIEVKSMEEKIVLLSPACSSFDEFSSFEERGNYFKSLVEGNLNE